MEPIKFRVTVGGNTYEATLVSPTEEDAKATLGLNPTDRLTIEVVRAALAEYARKLGEFLTQQLTGQSNVDLEGARITEEGIEFLPRESMEELESSSPASLRPVIRWSISQVGRENTGSSLSSRAKRTSEAISGLDLDWRPIRKRSRVELMDAHEQETRAFKVAEERRIQGPRPNSGDDARGVGL